ncbi:MAG: RluA family pseudouridine synthase [bacterium]|nr:RluA family pseudouridine synthase [bacterium]
MFKIIYEDEYLIAADKPSGMLCIPAPGNEKNTLTDLLNRELAGRGVSVKAHPCHRLDRETSGVILYAKGKKMQQTVMELFYKQQVKKKYIAFVRGNPAKKAAVISLPIENKPAVTRYRILEYKNGFSVAEVEPQTGRTNQIRIHFRKINHPLLGETKFAFRRDFEIKFKRVALHSHELEFTHPSTGQKIVLTAPLAGDMQKFLDLN